MKLEKLICKNVIQLFTRKFIVVLAFDFAKKILLYFSYNTVIIIIFDFSNNNLDRN